MGSQEDMRRAVVLLSGGLDSATTLAIARQNGHECLALTFRYGQRHAIEVDAARRVAITDPGCDFTVRCHAAIGNQPCPEKHIPFEFRFNEK